MAALTNDQKSTIGSNADFQNRIASVLREKALYWYNLATADRASVNRRTQKRKRLATEILKGAYAESYKALVAQFWITQYTEDVATQHVIPNVGTINRLDVNGIPVSQEISSLFDPTYDYWAGYITGDENLTEIDW